MKIVIETIPHSQQRYNTVGDWYTSKTGGTVRIFVSIMDTGGWKYAFLVGVHELVEAFLCLHDGVAEESVTLFDKQYVNHSSEPGDDPQAPYQKQHCLATGIERILAALLGVKWAEYEEALEKLIIKREEEEKNGAKRAE